MNVSAMKYLHAAACAVALISVGFYTGAGKRAWVGAATESTTPAATPAAPTVAIAITPASLMKPDLAYGLLPRMEDMQSGNAAVKYLAACSSLPPRPKDEPELMDKIRNNRLEDMDEAAAVQIVDRYGMALKLAHAGARMDSADWETNIRGDGMMVILPALSNFRLIANVLTIAIRLDIKHQRWDAAHDKLQTGFAMARHLGQGETLIESLVGVATASSMEKCIEDWVAQPAAPNLYWPLVNLPHPFNDLRRPLSFERATAVFSIPEMRQMHDGLFPAEQMANFSARLDVLSRSLGDPSNLKDTLAAHSLSKAQLPNAKQFLIARGYNPQDVEKMPEAEILGRYFIRSYDEVADDMFKWQGLPFADAYAGMVNEEQHFQRTAAETNFLARILLPALSRARFTAARVDRQADMLQIVENIRSFATEKHALPDTLDQLALPVPLDPITGKPFIYERHDNNATLIGTAPDPGKIHDSQHYDITLRQP